MYETEKRINGSINSTIYRKSYLFLCVSVKLQIGTIHEDKMNRKVINYRAKIYRDIESSSHAIYIYLYIGKGGIYFSKSLALSSPDITI